MDFKKKMKQRLLIAIAYIVFGVVLTAIAVITRSENYFLSSYGIALAVMGILRIGRYRKITASTDSLRKQELAESDERNRMIAERARSWAFSFSIMSAGLWVIVLSFLEQHEQAQPIAWFVCVMVLFYWIFYHILKRKY